MFYSDICVYISHILHTHISKNRWLGMMLFVLVSVLHWFLSSPHSPPLINQGEVGISATIIFEALTGERSSSHVELHNEGSTAIFYSWQQLPVPRSFPNLRTQTKSPHFYFNSSSGTHKHNQAPAATMLTSYSVCPCVKPSYCIFQPALNLTFCFPFRFPSHSRCDPSR